MAKDRISERLERSRRLREAVAETLRKVRRTHADLADREPPPPSPSPGPDPEPDERSSGGLLPDVAAVVDRARAVIERTKRVLEETGRHVAGRSKQAEDDETPGDSGDSGDSGDADREDGKAEGSTADR